MDHSHHDHSDMDMGDGDHMMCNMNMLFTWSTDNLCIVFSSWRITGAWSLTMSILAVIIITAGYEALREASRRYENRLSLALGNAKDPAEDNERRSLLSSGRLDERKGKVIKAALYGLQVFYSFFIMLLFMTYNGWIMLAVGFGAFLGYLFFGGSSINKSAACH